MNGVNRQRFGGVRERDGANFLNPPTPDNHSYPISQGFGLTLSDGLFRSFETKSWEQINFKGHWPEATVNYKDSASPVSVELRAFSPFIPLNLKDSSLPVTIMEYSLVNHSQKKVSGSIGGLIKKTLFTVKLPRN